MSTSSAPQLPQRTFSEDLAWCIQADAMCLSAKAATSTGERALGKVHSDVEDGHWNSLQKKLFTIMAGIHERIGSRENNLLADAVARCDFSKLAEAVISVVEPELKSAKTGERLRIQAFYRQAAQKFQNPGSGKAKVELLTLALPNVRDVCPTIAAYAVNPSEEAYPEVARISARVYETLPLTPSDVVAQTQQKQGEDLAERVRKNANGVFEAYFIRTLFETRGKDTLLSQLEKIDLNSAQCCVAPKFADLLRSDPQTWPRYAEVSIVVFVDAGKRTHNFPLKFGEKLTNLIKPAEPFGCYIQ